MKNAPAIRSPEATIHVVRERGGMGDWICISAALDGLAQKYPRRPITVWGPEKYRDLILQGHCQGMDRPDCCWEATDRLALRERPSGPLRAHLSGTVIDLNGPCPANQHERNTTGKPYESRIETFCQAAGVKPRRPVFALNPDELAVTLSQRQDLSQTIAIAPRAAAVVRSWPIEYCRDLGQRLVGAGISLLWIDATEEIIGPLPGLKAHGLTWSELAVTLIRVRCLITVDTGILHLAGAMNVAMLALFGPTDARLTVQHYPYASAMQGTRPLGLDCPCHYHNERGFGALACDVARPGCGAMRNLTPDNVAHALAITLKHSEPQR